MSYSSVWTRAPPATVASMTGRIVACRTSASIRRTTSPPRWSRPRTGGLSLASVPRPAAPLRRRLGHGLHVRDAQVQLPGDLPVGEVQAHQVEAEHPDPERPVTAGQDRAAQVVEAGAASRAAVPLPLRLDVIPAVAGDSGAAAMRAADALRPAVLPDQLEAARVVDQGQQVHQGWHGRHRG